MARRWPCARIVTKPHKAVRSAGLGRRPGDLVYIARMSATPPSADRPRSLTRRLLPLIVVIALLAVPPISCVGHGGISLEALVRHRMAIGAFVQRAPGRWPCSPISRSISPPSPLSLPGAVFLTVAGGFLFGLAVGASAAVIGATPGATLIFLVARTALGEPLLRRAGPRAAQLAQGFRDDAFSYLSVPAAGAGLSVLPGQSGAGFRRRAAGAVRRRDRARRHSWRVGLCLRRHRPRQRHRRATGRERRLPRRRPAAIAI